MKLIKGFSLIELLVVIAIIAILAGMAIPVYQNYTIRAGFAKITPVYNQFISDMKKALLTIDMQGLTQAYNNAVNSYSSAWQNVLANAASYAVPPYLAYFSILGSTGGAGHTCTGWGYRMFFSNFDSTGAYSTANSSANVVIADVWVIASASQTRVLCEYHDGIGTFASQHQNAIAFCTNVPSGSFNTAGDLWTAMNCS